jgi:uncharacterized membrane protein YfcA
MQIFTPFTMNLIIFFPLGFIFGILTGFLGIGGGFFMTPALNILGFQMVYAIGTSFCAIAGKTFIGAIRHYGLGNVDLKLGIILGVFSILGVDLGKKFVFHLERLDLAGTYVRFAYILTLLLISISMLKEYFQYKNSIQKKTNIEIDLIGEVKSPLVNYISRIKIPPTISLPHSGLGALSIWIILFFGMLIGFLSGFMGIGGGFIGLPVLIYGMGVPTIIAIGTSLVNVFITSLYGTFIYAMEGKVEWISVLILLAGSVVGIQVGVYATKYVTAVKIRMLFALFLLLIAISILLKQIQMVALSSHVMVGSAFLLSFKILSPLIKNLFQKILD